MLQLQLQLAYLYFATLEESFRRTSKHDKPCTVTAVDSERRSAIVYFPIRIWPAGWFSGNQTDNFNELSLAPVTDPGG